MDNSNSTFNLIISACFRVTILAAVLYLVYTSLKGKPSGIVILLGLLFTYGFYYAIGRIYLQENFESIEQIVKENDVILDTSTAPYLNKPINSVDDYEMNLVFENENHRGITKDLRNKLMSQYPMDWSTQPASSAYFSKGQKESFENKMPLDLSMNEIVYKNVSGTNLQPPDTDAVEKQERKILQTYQPKNADDLNTYNIEDARELIKKIYDARGLVPEVEHAKDSNVYTVVATRKKGEKIQYEDDLGDATAEESTDNMENVTVVPQAATDILKESDPFYDTHKKTRMDKWDYTKYTPELERMFAPTYPRNQWY
jgi:predicted DNA-binding protein YlxM (UPF0122 family)